MNFNDIINNMKSSLKSLVTTESSNEFIEKIGSLDKQIDEVVSAHENTTKELQETKDLYINAVKNFGFKTPSNDDPTKVEQPKTLDEIMKNNLDKIIKEEKNNG